MRLELSTRVSGRGLHRLRFLRLRLAYPSCVVAAAEADAFAVRIAAAAASVAASPFVGFDAWGSSWACSGPRFLRPPSLRRRVSLQRHTQAEEDYWDFATYLLEINSFLTCGKVVVYKC